MSPVTERYLPYLSLVCATLLWSSSFIALKVAFRVYDPMFVIFGRMFVATLFILLFLKPLRHLRYRKGDLKYLAFMGLSEPCLYFIFEAIALENTSASQAGMITGALPLIVGIVAWVFLKEQMNVRIVSGFILAIVGIILLTVSSEVTENAPNPLFGNFMEFLAMITATGYIITMKKLSHRYSSLFLTTFQALIGTFFYLPLLFLPSTQLPLVLSPASAFAIVYLGVFVTFAGYGSYNYAVSKIPVSQATSFINLIPVFTLIMGVTILDDQLTLPQYVAVAIIFAGIYLSQSKKR
ncbi:MAG: DMT family transporter [SAR324 cluster bacterium]|nr:DMT family transporter [SAR324 cluster bacterium]